MSSDMSDDKNIPTDKEADCETVASQEEIYLEETEEEVHTILFFDVAEESGRMLDENDGERELDLPDTTYLQRETVCECVAYEVTRPETEVNNNRIVESLDEELGQAAEELITGDSDDPPLSEDTVADMLRVTSNTRLPRAA
jgi:hypothetical protein